MKISRSFIVLFLLFILAGLFRLYNINWDDGYHMHPDERAIILSVIKLAPPTSITEFLSPDSPWNPKFFAYGSLPFYLLYLTGNALGTFVAPMYGVYDGIQIAGRYLSILFDLGTMIWLYLLGKRLLSRNFGFLTVAFYGLSTLPIQLSHFYAVDTLLTFFVTGTLYLLLNFFAKPSLRQATFIGIFLGAALATKMSAAVLLLPIGAVFLMQLYNALPHNLKKTSQVVTTWFLAAIPQGVVLLLSAVLIFFIAQPYAFIDFPTFSSHTIEQSRMTRDPFTFPYTLQYVGKVPYVYELKNILFFGMGPILTFLSLAGILLLTISTVRSLKKQPSQEILVLLLFFWGYFLLVGSFSIGFMRYMLPIYPLFCLAAAYFCKQAIVVIPPLKKPQISASVGFVLFVLLLIWPLSFLQIYTRPNTRVQATEWIHTHIPIGSTIALEHWDDALPMSGQEAYRFLSLGLYDPETPEKWQLLRQQLTETDYIILASNRLYTPLMKLTDCRNLPPGRCYPDSADYYKRLFNGTLGFSLVADISSYPTIPFTSISLPDQSADESFTVYDHPRILIFQKDNPETEPTQLPNGIVQ